MRAGGAAPRASSMSAAEGSRGGTGVFAKSEGSGDAVLSSLARSGAAPEGGERNRGTPAGEGARDERAAGRAPGAAPSEPRARVVNIPDQLIMGFAPWQGRERLIGRRGYPSDAHRVVQSLVKTGTSGLGFVANDFDVVTVRTKDERGIVGPGVLRAQAGCAVVLATRLQSRTIEGVDLLACLGREREVETIRSILRGEWGSVPAMSKVTIFHNPH